MSRQRSLPPELTSLVHHIELNKAGWWEKAIQQLLIMVIWISGKVQPLSGILEDLRQSFQVDIENGKAETQLKRLCSKGILVCLPGERYKLAETFLKKYEADIRDAQSLEVTVERLFVEILNRKCPDLDAKNTWEDFNEQFLNPFIREVGANTYKLLSEGQLNLHPARFERFLKNYPPDTHAAFKDAIDLFLIRTTRKCVPHPSYAECLLLSGS